MSRSKQTYMHEYHIARLAVFGDSPEGVHNVLARRRMGASIVAQNQHFAFVKSLGLDEIFLDISVSGRYKSKKEERERDESRVSQGNILA